MTKPDGGPALSAIDDYCGSCKYRNPPYSRDGGHCYVFRDVHEGLTGNVVPYCAQFIAARMIAEREKE